MIAYLDFSVSTTGMLTGVKVRQDDNLLNDCHCKSCGIFCFLCFSPFVNPVIVIWHTFCLQPVWVAPGFFYYGFIYSTAALFSEEWNYTAKISYFIATLCFLADLSCSCQCTVPLHKAAVWAVLFSPNCHLSGSVLRSGLCLVVPRKVWRIIPSPNRTSKVSCLHLCCLLVFTQVISPSWFLPLSWRAACRCGWARSASTASETPSVRTQSWSSALKDWGLRLSYWRQGERPEYQLSLKSSASKQNCLSQKNPNTNRCFSIHMFPHMYRRSRLLGAV